MLVLVPYLLRLVYLNLYSYVIHSYLIKWSALPGRSHGHLPPFSDLMRNWGTPPSRCEIASNKASIPFRSSPVSAASHSLGAGVAISNEFAVYLLYFVNHSVKSLSFIIRLMKNVCSLCEMTTNEVVQFRRSAGGIHRSWWATVYISNRAFFQVMGEFMSWRKQRAFALFLSIEMYLDRQSSNACYTRPNRMDSSFRTVDLTATETSIRRSSVRVRVPSSPPYLHSARRYRATSTSAFSFAILLSYPRSRPRISIENRSSMRFGRGSNAQSKYRIRWRNRVFFSDLEPRDIKTHFCLDLKPCWSAISDHNCYPCVKR